MKREDQKLLFLLSFLAISAISAGSYHLGIQHAEEKPAEVITKVEYIDDKCLCVKCSHRINFQEVQHLIAKID